MFRNRALQLQVVKKPTAPGEPTQTCKDVDPDEIATIIMYHAEHASKIIMTAMVANKLLNTACEIALITARVKIK